MENTAYNVRAILAGQASADTPVTVKGWVRTRRDSKAGISFVHLSDGSAFHPLQVVAPNTLPNYTDEVLKITTGCAVEATGTIVPSPGQGPAVRDAGERHQGDRLGRGPGHLPDPAQAAHDGVPARGGASAAAHQHHSAPSRGCATRLAQAIHRYFDEQRFLLGQHADHHHHPTPKAPARCSASRRSTSPICRAPHAGKIDFGKDFFGREAFLTVSGQLNVEAYCLALSQGLHLRSDVPRRELQHQPPPRRILDDRARDRVRRPDRRRRRWPKRLLKYHLRRPCWKSGPTTWRSSTSASRRVCVAEATRHSSIATFERMDYGEAITVLEPAQAQRSTSSSSR